MNCLGPNQRLNIKRTQQLSKIFAIMTGIKIKSIGPRMLQNQDIPCLQFFQELINSRSSEKFKLSLEHIVAENLHQDQKL